MSPACFVPPPPFAARPSRPHSRTKRAGLRFEDKVQRALLSRWSSDEECARAFLFCNPWLRFRDKYISPDFLAIWPRDRRALLFEIKLSHTARAFSQLRSRYLPALRSILPTFRIRYAEVCQNYAADPLFEVFYGLDDFLAADATSGVIVWR